jgi:tetratricopeptide (TPR) repeat protein
MHLPARRVTARDLPPARGRLARARRSGGGLLVLVSAVTGAALARPALAAPPKTTAELTAEQHFKEGEERYSARQFQAALDEYQAGFTILPLPGFLVNIGQCYRRMGDLARARTTFERFVLVAPDSPLVPEVRQLIADIDRQQRSAYLDTPEVLPLSYGGSEPPQPSEGGAPSTGPVVSSAMLQATAPPAAASPSPRALVDLETEAGAEAAAPGRQAEPRDGDTSSATGRRRWWLWGTLAAAVVGGSIAAYVGLANPGTVVLHEGSLGALRR